MFGALACIGGGVCMIAVGFWGGHTWPQPYATLAAWCAPLGLLLTLAGIVSVYIPSFFF